MSLSGVFWLNIVLVVFNLCMVCIWASEGKWQWALFNAIMVSYCTAVAVWELTKVLH